MLFVAAVMMFSIHLFYGVLFCTQFKLPFYDKQMHCYF